MSENRNDKNSPLVSILVLNYNGKRFLKDCFESLLRGNYKNIEVILVDNNSSDDSVAYTRENFSDIQVYQTNSNAGYSRAYNLAFTVARGKYYVLLNNDVIVEPDWLSYLVERAEKDSSIAALQPKIRSLIDDGFFEYAGACGGFMDRYGYPFLRGRIFYTIEADTGQYDNETEVFWTSGAAMFVRASVITRDMQLDEDFVHHMEEIDLCWRLLLAGYKLKVIPKSVIYHYAGATIKADSFKKLYWNHRNGLFTMLKNLESGQLLKKLTVRLFLDLLNICFAGFIQFDWKHVYAILKAHVWILLNFGLIREKRRIVQGQRKVTDQQIFRYVYPGTLVFDYFIKKKKTFSSLNFLPTETT